MVVITCRLPLRYDKDFEAYVIYFGDDNKGYEITKI